MALHQIGQREQARAALARLRESLVEPRRAKDADATLDIVQEANALIGSAATTER
jgi:hypothetical protein